MVLREWLGDRRRRAGVNRTRSTTAWALGLVLGVSACGGPQSAEDVIGEVLEAYGGAEVVRAVEGYRLEATIQAHTRQEAGSVLRIVEGPTRLKVLVRYPSGAEIRILEDDQGWQGGSPASLAPVAGPMLGAMVLQAARTTIPWILDEKRAEARLVESDGTALLLEIPLGEGRVLQAAIDPGSYRVLGTEAVLSMGPAEVRFRTTYDDFR